MPYIDGKRVTLDEWKTLQRKAVAAPAASDEETDAILGTPTKQARSNIVRNVALAATGTVIEPDVEPELTDAEIEALYIAESGTDVEVLENEGGITE